MRTYYELTYFISMASFDNKMATMNLIYETYGFVKQNAIYLDVIVVFTFGPVRLTLGNLFHTMRVFVPSGDVPN